MVFQSRPIEERFWEKVEKTESCWLWRGGLSGYYYGTFLLGGKSNQRVAAHRFSYEIAYGVFDKSLFVCHRCDVPRCVRPDHLFLGTQKDNMQDAAQKGRIRGFRWTSENHPGKGKPRPDSVKLALAKARQKPFSLVTPSGQRIDGVNLRQFCRTHGLSHGCMYAVLKGKFSQHKGYTAVKD